MTCRRNLKNCSRSTRKTNDGHRLDHKSQLHQRYENVDWITKYQSIKHLDLGLAITRTNTLEDIGIAMQMDSLQPLLERVLKQQGHDWERALVFTYALNPTPFVSTGPACFVRELLSTDNAILSKATK